MSIFPFLKTLSFGKLVNIIKVLSTYALSTVLKQPLVKGMPPVFNIEPTNLCNLSCLHCPTGSDKITRETGVMGISFFENIITDIKNSTMAVQLYFQGEPFLHKNILDFIKIIKKNKIYLIISTNGHFFENKEFTENLVKLGPDELIISLDGATEETYKIYRKNGNFSKVLNGIENLVRIKEELRSKTPEIIIQFVVMKHNEHEIELIKKIAESKNVNKLELKSAQLYEWHDRKNFIPDKSGYSRYTEADNLIKLKSGRRLNCLRAWTTAVITWDGELLPCCFDKNAEYSYGKIDPETKIKKLWHSKKSIEFRRSVLKERENIKICRNCTLGVKVKVG
jgi:radical SAM protein with 4Fe4S-binding SPASM domain